MHHMKHLSAHDYCDRVQHNFRLQSQHRAVTTVSQASRGSLTAMLDRIPEHMSCTQIWRGYSLSWFSVLTIDTFLV